MSGVCNFRNRNENNNKIIRPYRKTINQQNKTYKTSVTEIDIKKGTVDMKTIGVTSWKDLA